METIDFLLLLLQSIACFTYGYLEGRNSGFKSCARMMGKEIDKMLAAEKEEGKEDVNGH